MLPPSPGYDDRNATNPYLFGSIVQGDKCFQIEPLERGLAQVSNWSIAKTQFAPMPRALPPSHGTFWNPYFILQF